jgi:capsular polysaccharide biosynthesis protein
MEELIVPTFLNNWEFVNYRGYKYWQKQYLPRWVGDIYKDRILPNIKKTQKKRIYITRKDARYRKVINEKDVIGVLNSYGFEMVNLDKMKVIDQIGLFANAEVVVSIFGAGLTNMLFCPSQTRLLVIYPEYFHDAAYRILASTLDVSYYYLVGKTPDVSVPPQQEDVLVNINEFRESLDRLLR